MSQKNNPICHLEIIPFGYAKWIVIGKTQVEKKYYDQLDDKWIPYVGWVEVYHEIHRGSYDRVKALAITKIQSKGYDVVMKASD